MKAWIENGAVRDICPGNPDELYHPDIARHYDTDVPDGTLQGATLVAGAWVNPEPVVIEPTEPVVTYPTLTPMAFYLAFTPLERIAIKTSANPMVQEFWATYQLAVQAGASIDMALQSNQQGIGYLAMPEPAGPGILAADRVAQVLQGVAQ
jgi:hypothetical protein